MKETKKTRTWTPEQRKAQAKKIRDWHKKRKNQSGLQKLAARLEGYQPKPKQEREPINLAWIPVPAKTIILITNKTGDIMTAYLRNPDGSVEPVTIEKVKI